MKKSFLTAAVALAALATVSCTGNNAENNAEGTDSAANEQVAESVNTFPWDFPQEVKVEGEVGQMALAPYTYYAACIEKGEDLTNEALIFYNAKLEEIGDKTSKMDGKEVPNVFVIPLDKEGQAKKGDILLTWWQNGSGMQRAIVRDATNPAEPVVDYLDLSYSNDPEKPGMGEKFGNHQLKPGSFNVLTDGEWQPGAQLAVKKGDNKWELATLIRVEGDKVLVKGFSSKVAVYSKADTKLVPFKENIKVGDTVWCKFAASFMPGYKVTKVDMNIGRIWVEKDNRTEVFSICEVTKVLD